MGHYRSEMGYEAEDAAAEKAAKEQREKLIARIQKDIDRKGMAATLADFVEANAWLLVKYPYHHDE